MPLFRIVYTKGEIVSCTDAGQEQEQPEEHTIIFNPRQDELLFALVKAPNAAEAENTVRLLSRAS